MSFLKKFSLTAILLAWAAMLPLYAALSTSPEKGKLPEPATVLLPEEVVGIVISALARNDQPHIDAGIQTTFNFASPQNRVNTGPLEKFTRMVKEYPYGVMVNHRESELSEAVHVGNSAYILAQLITLDGSVAVFAFRLSKQVEGRYRDMWMTDAVWPVSKAHSL